MKSKPILASFAAVVLAACAPGGDQPPPTEAAAAQPIRIEAPAGVYRLDPNHASLLWSLRHHGLSDYTARFAKFDWLD